MPDTLEAAEALLATLSAARTHLNLMAHSQLGFRGALAIELRAEVGQSRARDDAAVVQDQVDRRLLAWRRSRALQLGAAGAGGTTFTPGLIAVPAEELAPDEHETTRGPDLEEALLSPPGSAVEDSPPPEAMGEADSDLSELHSQDLDLLDPITGPLGQMDPPSGRGPAHQLPVPTKAEDPEVGDTLVMQSLLVDAPIEVEPIAHGDIELTDPGFDPGELQLDPPLAPDEEAGDFEHLPFDLPLHDFDADEVDDDATTLSTVAAVRAALEQEERAAEEEQVRTNDEGDELAPLQESSEDLTASPDEDEEEEPEGDKISDVGLTGAAEPAYLPETLPTLPPRGDSPRTPRLSLPQVLEPSFGAEDPEDRPMAASIQILGVGKAQTVTPTLALGASSEDDSEELAGEEIGEERGGLSVGFQPPEEPAVETHVPELTEDGVSSPEAWLYEVKAPQSPEARALEQSNLADFRQRAAEAETRGDLHTAALHWSDLLTLAPDNVEAHLARGRCLMELGDYAAAMSDFQRAEDLLPERADPLVEMGNLFFARKEYRRAIEFYDQAIELEPAHAMARCRRGICHHYRKNHEQALQDLQRAYSLDPEIPNIGKYVQMAVKAMRRGGR